MIVQQLKIQIVLYLHILISQPIIRLIGSTEEYAYDTLPHGICQFNVSGSAASNILMRQKDQSLGKKMLSLRWGDFKRSRVVTLVSILILILFGMVNESF